MTEELKLQIFISTHSLTLLKQIISLHNNEKENYELIYFKDQRYPYPTSYINYRSLKADLFDEMNVPSPKVKLYCEDEDTQKILELLLVAAKNLNITHFTELPQFDVVPVFLGCEQLLQLPKCDTNFKTVSILLDGDARMKEKLELRDYIQNRSITKGKSTITHAETIVFLPNFFAPESYLYSIIYEYIENTANHLDFWRALSKNPETTNYTSDRIKKEIIDVSPLTNENLKKSPVQNIMFSFCENSNILTDYYSKNKRELEIFIKDFYKSLSIIQKNSKLEDIKKSWPTMFFFDSIIVEVKKMSHTKSPLRYPGGKSQLWKFVKSTIEYNDIRNTIYCEPFAGGSGVTCELLLGNHVDEVVINDYDPAIFSFWNACINHTEELIKKIIEVPVTLEEWHRQKEIYNKFCKDPYSIEGAFATFF